ncbi:MAG: cupin domain-containing protein [Blastocatellia bacterium]
MSDRATSHEMTEFAAFYALGALSQREARSFEDHLNACEVCAGELDTFERTVTALGFGTPAQEPPSRLRAELMARLEDATLDQPAESLSSKSKPFLSILSSDGEWHELQKGVSFKNLYIDRATGIATSLVKMQPGTKLPVHQHLGPEQFFIIEGDCYVAGEKLGPGDYHRAEAGSIHESTCTVDGTLFLLIAPERYEILEAR